jgi:uncharacterized protein (TIGR02217 family)
MVYVDIPFPDCIAMGAQSDPTWSTSLAATIGGTEYANQNWADARHAYDVSFAVRNATDYLLIREHFHQVRGRAKSFPFKDFLDFEVTQAQGLLADDAIDPTGDYQMYRRYGSGADAYDRKITRPVSGTITVYRTRSSTTTDATADATIDHTTGLVTMANHLGGDVYAWAGEFRVPCRYDTDRLPGVAINREPGIDGDLLVRCDSIPLVEVREG